VVALTAVVAGVLLRSAVSAPEAVVVSCPVIAELAGWPGGFPVAANNSGQIVGVVYERGNLRSFVWSEGRTTKLSVPGAESTSAKAINDRGDVVGWSSTAGGTKAFLWRDGKISVLPVPGGLDVGSASDVNERGEIVGWATDAADRGHVLLWRNGKVTDLGRLRLEFDEPGEAIGERGEIVTAGPVLWRDGKSRRLAMPPGWTGVGVVDINGRGQIVGEGELRYERHAFLWEAGRVTDLGWGTDASAINEAGQVVGDAYTGDQVVRAFVLQGGKLTDLGALSGHLTSRAVAITDGGLIVGWSSASAQGADTRAVTWTMRPSASGRCPVPKPPQSGDSVVVRERSITVVGSITELRADGGRALVLVDPPAEDACRDVFVWNQSSGRLVTVVDGRRCVEGDRYGGVALAGDRVAHVERSGGHNLESFVVVTALATGRNSTVASASASGQGAWGDEVGDPHGAGGLLVYEHSTRCGVDDGPLCPAGVADSTIVTDRIRLASPGTRVVARSTGPLTVLAVGGGRIVARLERGDLIVLAPRSTAARLVAHEGVEAERLIATYPYRPGEVLAAATDGRTLVVQRAGKLDVIALPGGAGRQPVRHFPTAGALADVDGGVAVVVQGRTVRLLHLASGRSAAVAGPAAGPAMAQLEPAGLYVAAGRTLTFTPRSAVRQRLGG
jgi:probable HAF family extracellular repeat protein